MTIYCKENVIKFAVHNAHEIMRVHSSFSVVKKKTYRAKNINVTASERMQSHSLPSALLSSNEKRWKVS